MKTIKTCKTGCGKMKSGGKVTAVKKMQKGGKTTSFTEDISKGLDNVFRKTYPFNVPHDKVTKALKYVDDKITDTDQKQPDWYNSLKSKVKKTMHVPDKKQKGGPIRPVKPGVKQSSFKELQDKVHSDIKKRTGKTTPISKMAKGGATKKYQMGGSTIVGMPKYSNNPRSDAGRILQSGGSFAPNRAVQASCKGGMVRDENGRCVTARIMQKGGDTSSAQIKKGENLLKNLINKKSTMTPEEYNKIKKNGVNITPKKKMQKGGFPDLNKDGKVTKADILKGRGVIKRLGGAKKR